MTTNEKACDLLIKNALTLTLDADDRIIAHGFVAVSGDRIVSVGPEDDHRGRWLPGKTLDAGGNILMPGLVNTHNHSPLMIVRGMVEDRGFAPAYLKGVPQGDALGYEEAPPSPLGDEPGLRRETIVDYYVHPVLAEGQPRSACARCCADASWTRPRRVSPPAAEDTTRRSAPRCWRRAST